MYGNNYNDEYGLFSLFLVNRIVPNVDAPAQVLYDMIVDYSNSKLSITNQLTDNCTSAINAVSGVWSCPILISPKDKGVKGEVKINILNSEEIVDSLCFTIEVV